VHELYILYRRNEFVYKTFLLKLYTYIRDNDAIKKLRNGETEKTES
jgi:hypothetical protein